MRNPYLKKNETSVRIRTVSSFKRRFSRKMFVFPLIGPCLISLISAAVLINKPGIFPEYGPTPEEQLVVQDKNYWFEVADKQLKRNLKFDRELKQHIAKNVVILIGDGMGISTLTAARIYKGQRTGAASGEEHDLVFDNFPNVALVKTYNVDMQVPDSAGTATALFTGVKTRYKAAGVDVKANKTFADPRIYQESKLETIMTWAQKANKDTGIITTTRITHATPACTYASVHFREWECDSEIPQDFKPFVKDIARQLIEDVPGNQFKVIMGGGYQQLGHITEDLSDGECVRTDGLNLTHQWIEKHKGLKAAFVTNNAQLSAIGEDTDYLLGLFHHDHLPYDLTRDQSGKGTPSLTEMTRKGLSILKKGPNGYVLMIEGGRIDHGHHNNYARLAMDEASEFDRTVALVLEETGPDTLVVVTADHSHAMTINGYSRRGNDILGYGIETEDDKPALTLTYANGPGFKYHYSANQTTILGPWLDVRFDESRLNNPKYRHLAAFELDDESHGGEDVAIFATGPGSHLVRGVIEQNYVAHLVSYAACIGPRAQMNPHCEFESNHSRATDDSKLRLIVLLICNLLLFITFNSP